MKYFRIAFQRLFIFFLLSWVVMTQAFAVTAHKASAWTSLDPKNPMRINLKRNILKVMNDFYNNYAGKEYFSGMSVAIYAPEHGTQTFYIGKKSHDRDSGKIDENTLFDIGSITKSFTSSLILQLVKEGKLSLDDPLGKYLPQYPKWSELTIRQLLNMTSGLPNYSDSPNMNWTVTIDLGKLWSKKELIDIVYPPEHLNPPLNPGYNYTNTGYVLTAMIIEKVTGDLYENILNKYIQELGLKSTFYPVPNFTAAVKAKMAHGYSYNPNTNPGLLGKDMLDNNLSWGGAAGAIVSNSTDVVKWVKMLLATNDVLDKEQERELKSIVSLKTGLPIKNVSKQEAQGYGLGVVRFLQPEIGNFWFYEGETLGFRTAYIYVPKSGVIIVAMLNSAVSDENDAINILMKQLFKASIEAYKLK